MTVARRAPLAKYGAFVASGLALVFLLFSPLIGISLAHLNHGMSGAAAWGLGTLEALTPLLAVTALALLWKWRKFPPRRLAVACVVASVLFLAGEVGFGVSHHGSDHQRCVDQSTLVVVPSSDCAASTTQGADFEWYYGGIGYHVGSSVQDGSVTAPSDDSGGGSGQSGDDGSDDGGGDGGGSDGGGDDGG